MVFYLNSPVLKQDTGGDKSKSLEYSENSTKTYLSFKYDSLDSITNPMKGVKSNFIYNFQALLEIQNLIYMGQHSLLKVMLL